MEHWIFIINISIRSSPWQTFDETIKELSRFKQEYSQAASVLVGDIKTLLMDSRG
ncbi:hemolysin E [Escherichia coli]|nr:hemolysin E [Escherichia coli]